MSDNKHLDLDLEFLGKEDPEKVKVSRKASTEAVAKKKSDGRFYLILFSTIGGILLLVGLASLVEDSSSTSFTSTSNNTNQDDSVIVGDYSCSLYHSGKSDALQPSVYIESQVDNGNVALQLLSDEIDDLTLKIENTYVNTESQYSIDNYNDLIEEYNQMLIEYKNNSDVLDVQIDRYNAQVATYNNYLDSNCTKY